jgi:hypothetical protein
MIFKGVSNSVQRSKCQFGRIVKPGQATSAILAEQDEGALRGYLPVTPGRIKLTFNTIFNEPGRIY